MKAIVIFAILALNSCALWGQSRLDTLYPLVSHRSIGEIILPHENGFYVIGHGTDTVPWNSLGSIFTSFSLDGAVRFSTYTHEPDKRRVYENMDAIIIDSIAYTVFTGSSPIQIVQFSVNTGQIVKRTTLPNEAGENNRPFTYSIHQLDSSRLLINSACRDYQHQLVTQLAVYDFKKDSLSYFFNSWMDYHQHVTDILIRPEGFILGGYMYKGDPFGLDFTAHAIFIWLDLEFAETKRFISQDAPYEWFGYDMIMDEHQSVISTNCPSHKYFDGNYYWTVGRPAILKLDSTGSFLWQRRMGRDIYSASYSQFHCLLMSNEGDGYIAAGGQPNFSDSLIQTQIDTNDLGEFLRYEALIAKVSLDGDSLWSRWYYKSDLQYSKSIFMDMIPHPDGGYILTGSSNKEPIQFGVPHAYTWILHVDEYGCAVPGCHLTVSTTDPDLPDPIRFHPNPASNELYIFQQEDQAIRYTIVNMTGQVMTTLVNKQSGTTAIVDVSQYTPGEYLLMKQDESGRIRTDKWIKL